MADAAMPPDWVTRVFDAVGEVGVGLLLLLDNVLPVVPSEVVLSFAGYAVLLGDFDPWLVWATGTLGSLVGAWVLYGVGAGLGRERLDRLAARPWFVLFGTSDLARGRRWFSEHGDIVVFFGRFVPLVRSIVSVPAGSAGMPLLRFSVLTGLGSGLWNALFLWLGYRLGDRWRTAVEFLEPVSRWLLVALVVGLGVLVVRRLRQRA